MGGVPVTAFDVEPVHPAALDELAGLWRDLPPLGAWVDAAACGGMLGDAEVWTADRPDPEELAYAERVCRRCPVRAECADYAGSAPVWGVWGGVWHGKAGKRQTAA
jgi:hypothetical protein